MDVKFVKVEGKRNKVTGVWDLSAIQELHVRCGRPADHPGTGYCGEYLIKIEGLTVGHTEVHNGTWFAYLDGGEVLQARTLKELKATTRA